MFMGAQEVIVSYPEGKVIVGTVDAVESVCVSVRSFISTVQPFEFDTTKSNSESENMRMAAFR